MAVVGRARKQKDIGVILTANLDVSEQFGTAGLKANKMFGLIRGNI